MAPAIKHPYGTTCSLESAKTMDLTAVITTIKLVHSKAVSLGYQCHLTTVGDKFNDPICVIKTSGRPTGSDYRCLYWVLQGTKTGSNYWFSSIGVWEPDKSLVVGLKCLHFEPMDFTSCNSISDTSNTIKDSLDTVFAIIFN